MKVNLYILYKVNCFNLTTDGDYDWRFIRVEGVEEGTIVLYHYDTIISEKKSFTHQ